MPRKTEYGDRKIMNRNRIRTKRHSTKQMLKDFKDIPANELKDKWVETEEDMIQDLHDNNYDEYFGINE